MGENKSNFSPLIRNECVSKALYTVYFIIAKYSFPKHSLYKANMCLVIYMCKRNCVIVVSGMRQWQIQDRGINLFPGEPRDTLRHCVTLFMSGHTFLHFISLSVLHTPRLAVSGPSSSRMLDKIHWFIVCSSQ